MQINITSVILAETPFSNVSLSSLLPFPLKGQSLYTMKKPLLLFPFKKLASFFFFFVETICLGMPLRNRSDKNLKLGPSKVISRKWNKPLVLSRQACLSISFMYQFISMWFLKTTIFFYRRGRLDNLLHEDY